MLLWKNSRLSVHTNEGSKWIFVLSTTKVLYVGEVDILFQSIIIFLVQSNNQWDENNNFILLLLQKKKGSFQHSSFLAGGAITAAGRLVVKEGNLMVCTYASNLLKRNKSFDVFIKVGVNNRFFIVRFSGNLALQWPLPSNRRAFPRVY